MTRIGRPRGLVAHAGRRLWPQLTALAQWGDGLEELRLVLAHGDDEDGGPADRLESFVARELPHVRTSRTATVHDDDPIGTSDALVAATRDAGPWLIDVSGGTRLMFAGGVHAAARAPETAVVFRDPDGPWHQVHPSGRARPLESADVRAVERFPIASLLAVTWADEERHVVVPSLRMPPAIWSAGRRCVDNPHRSWRREFQRAVTATRREGCEESTGHLFEEFVVACLRHLGCDEDDVSLGVVLSDDGVSVQEVDVVVNARGFLHVIDCKLSDVDRGSRRRKVRAAPLGTQIREASTTGRSLADGGGRVAMLRPNRTFTPELISLSREYDVTVIDRAVLARQSLPTVLERLVQPGRNS